MTTAKQAMKGTLWQGRWSKGVSDSDYEPSDFGSDVSIWSSDDESLVGKDFDLYRAKCVSSLRI